MKKKFTSINKVLIVIFTFFCAMQIANAQVDLTLKLYIEGLYIGGGTMNGVLYNTGLSPNPGDVDYITVKLLDPVTFVELKSNKGVLQSNGICHVLFPTVPLGNMYYIDICHQNALQTMSKYPVQLNAFANYDFTTASTQAYDNGFNLPMRLMESNPDRWAFYSGDFNHDCLINQEDFDLMVIDIQLGAGGYICTDINGDGVLDAIDFLVLDPTIQEGVITCALPDPIPVCACIDSCYIICPPDITICFDVPDSAVHIGKAIYGLTELVDSICKYDSVWSNSPGQFPVGTTQVKWFVSLNGVNIDSCTQNIIRKPPSVYTISFSTSPPIVAGVIHICNGQSITFTDNSTGISGRLWNFGNGFYSSNAVHTEAASHLPPGTYNASLTVYDDCKNPHDTTFQIIVDPAFGPDIYCISVVCPGDTVTYYTHANCTTYNWNVTGGTFYPVPSTSSNSATVIWGAGPHGTISLDVSGCTPSSCNIATVKTVYIVSAVIAVKGEPIICAGSETCYSIECIPGNTHQWVLNPANAGTITGQGTCSVCIKWDPAFFGDATLSVNYQNLLTGSGCSLPANCSHDNGCGGTGQLIVHVKPIFGIYGPSKVCPNTTSSPFKGKNLTDNSDVFDVSWKLITPVPTQLTFTTTALLNAYLWNAGVGKYRLTAYAPPGIFCNDSASSIVEVVQILNPGPISGPDKVCPGLITYYTVTPNMSGVTYTWHITGGTPVAPLNNSSIGIIWTTSGTVSVTQALSSSPFCESNSSPVFSVTTWPSFALPIITSSDPLTCLKSTITYSIPLPLITDATYLWSVVPASAGNITTANGTNTITINWISNSVTPIFVKLKISRCYSDEVLFPVTLLSLPPVPDIICPSHLCVGELGNFSTSIAGMLSYEWDFGNGNGSGSGNPVTHTYLTPDDFNVQLKVTNSDHCFETANTKVHVDGVPQLPVITGPSVYCIGDPNVSYSFSQPLFKGANYVWNVTGGSIISGQGSSSIEVRWNQSQSVGTISLVIEYGICPVPLVAPYQVTINPVPNPSIGIPSPLCVGSPLTFSSSGGPTYFWSFPGNSNLDLTNLTAPVVTYNSEGNYNASLTVTANGCTATRAVIFTVNPLPVAFVTTPDANSFCTYPVNITLYAVDADQYSFEWHKPGILAGNVPTRFNEPVTGPSTYYVVVTNQFGCTNTSNPISFSDGNCPDGPPIPGVTCVPDDNIDFTWAPPVCLNETFTKIGSASPPIGWIFDYAGATGSGATDTYPYTYPGVYKVTVTGYSTGTIFGTNTPCTPPLIQISKTHPVFVPVDTRFKVKFQCNGSVMKTILINTSRFINNISDYTWVWTDNGNNGQLFLSDINNPLPPSQTLSPGSHTLTLTAHDVITGATCTAIVNIVVPDPIVAHLDVSTPVCLESEATFTDNSIGIEKSRTFDPGGSGSFTFSNKYIYSVAGNFTVSLTVSDIYSCVSSDTKSITVHPAGIGNINVSSDLCEPVALTASGSGPNIWSNVNVQPIPYNILYINTGGYYTVKGHDPLFGCPYSKTVGPITVNPVPNATITGRQHYCQNEKLDIKTSSAGSTISWVQNPPYGSPLPGTPNLNIPLLVAGNFSYTVTITGLNGCPASATYSIIVDSVPSSPVIQPPGPITLCEPLSVNLSVDPPGATYLWSKSPTPPLSSSVNTGSTLTVTQSGTYSVIVQTINGCAYPAISPVVITVNPKPPVSISGKTILCEGETLNLSTIPVGGGTYQWNGPISGTTNPLFSPNIQLNNAGLFTVVVTNTLTSCTNSASVNVTVNPSPPIPLITSNPGGILCEGIVYTLNATPSPVAPIIYTWNTGQLGGSINVFKAGDYSVIASNQFGCKSYSNTVTIHPAPDVSCTPSGCYDFCNECDSITIPGPFGLTSYNWLKLVGNSYVSYSSKQNLSVIKPGGIYRLLGSNQWGCSDTSDALIINFHDCCPPPDTFVCVDTSCQYFIENTLSNYVPYSPAEPNVNITLNNIGGQFTGDQYLRVVDLPGPSSVKGDTILNGKWCCGKFCYDFKIFNDGQAGAINIHPQFRIYNKTNGKGFLFTSNVLMNETSGWKRIITCAGIDSMPVNLTYGTWTPISPAVAADWNSVASHVTDVIFNTEVSGNNNEVVGIDNVCWFPDRLTISCEKIILCGGVTLLANVTETGGCSNYKYRWSTGATTQAIQFVNPGTYHVKVTNCCGCVDSCTITVLPSDTAKMHLSTIVSDISCVGSSGTINLNVTGGQSPYSFYWSNGFVTQNIEVQNPGPYTVTVTDVSGCTATTTAIVNLEILNCSPATVGSINICAGTDFMVTANHTGSGVSFHYLWSDGIGGIYPDSKSIIANLPVGGYTLDCVVTDNCGSSCSSSLNVSVNPTPSASISPAGAVIACTVDGALTLTANTVFGTTFQWKKDGTNINGATSSTYAASASGSYTVVISNGTCSQESAATVVTVVANATSPIALTPSNINGCLNASTSAYFTGNCIATTVVTAQPDSAFRATTTISQGHGLYAFLDWTGNQGFINASTIRVPVTGFPAGSAITNVTVTLGLAHNKGGEMLLQIAAPGQPFQNLFFDGLIQAKVFGSSGGISSLRYTFADGGAAMPSTGHIPNNVVYAPFAPFSAYNGLNPNGNWFISVKDIQQVNGGRLDSASITITALSPTGGVIWYNVPIGGSILATTSSFNPITNGGASTATPGVRDFYAQCSNGGCSSSRVHVTFTVGDSEDDGNPCTVDACNPATGIITHTPGNCGVALNANVLLQGYYIGGGLMNALIYNLEQLEAVPNPSITFDMSDYITISAMEVASPHNLVDAQVDTLRSNGDVNVTFGPAVVANTSYYIKVDHRNSVETWSKDPVPFLSTTTYSFSTVDQSYGPNMAEVEPGIWAIYTGEVEKDGAVDISDFLALDPSIQAGDGGYLPGDLNGDGSVDITDFLILDPNIQQGLGANPVP